MSRIMIRNRRMSLTVVFLGLLVRAESASAQPVIDKNICGSLALAGIAEYLGRADLVERIFAELPPSGEPRSLRELWTAATRVGLHCKAVRWARDSGVVLNSPALVRLAPSGGGAVGHFVLLLGVTRDKVLVLDPMKPPAWIPLSELRRSWNGVALHISTSASSLPHNGEQRRIALLGIASVILSVGGQFVGWFLVVGIVRDLQKHRRARSLAVCLGITAAVALVSTLCVLFVHGSGDDTSGTVRAVVATPEHQTFQAHASPSGKEQVIHAEYKLVNNTAEIIRVGRIKTSCSCAVPHLSAKAIPPQGVVTVSADVAVGTTALSSFWISVGLETLTDDEVIFRGTILKDTH